MQLPSGLQSSILKPVGTIIGPGGIALTLLLYPAAVTNDGVGSFIRANSGLFGFYALVACVILGYFIENLGSRVEDFIFVKTGGKGQLGEWYDYLATKANEETVGFRYISTIVVRLKIELALFVLTILSFPAYAIYHFCLELEFPYLIFSVVSLVLSLLSGYESYSSVKLLNRTRTEILKRMKNT